MVSEEQTIVNTEYYTGVLILVLVEDGLGVGGLPAENSKDLYVLILVLVEDGLGDCVAPATGHPNCMS
mgnify:CR=1 FL=1